MDQLTPLPTRARAVVVGAGIAGCSVAYHLTRLGWRDVVVVDQGPLFETGGSTSHAPGLVFQVNPSKTMSAFAQRTVDLFTRLELEGEPCARSVGSLEVAWTPERLTDLKRRLGYAMSWGLEAHLLDPGETRELIPLLSERILGALYVPSDIQTRATRPAEAMAREAERRGASFHGGVTVTGFGMAGGRIAAVHTSQGEVRTEVVVAAAGIWAPKLGGMAGVPIPLSPMQHLYAVTTPLPELAGAAEEVSQPVLRHQDEEMYFRQVGECYGIGSYQHEPLLVDAGDIPAHGETSMPPAERPFTPRHFEKGLAAAGNLLPCLKGAELTRRLNGLFSFTTDGFPVLGESPRVPGFWSAQAVWITHAGGVGQAVAEWLVHGEPGVDLRECDIRRFHPHAHTRPYVRARAAQQYREVYDIIHPRQQIASPRDLRLTPFHPRQRELGARLFESAGWERPQWYESNAGLLDSLEVTGEVRSGWEAVEWSPIVAAEHAATRERVALFDLTPFAKFEVTGPGALQALQRLAANQMDRPVGAVTYTAMLTPRGGIKCDLTVTRLEQERFLVITGGAMGLHDLGWIEAHIPSDGSASVEDVSATYCCIGLWGPRARDLLSGLCEEDLGDRGVPVPDRPAADHRRGARPRPADLLRGRARLGDLRPFRAGPASLGPSLAGGAAPRRDRRRRRRLRLAAPGEGLPPLGPGHPHRAQPLRGGSRLRGEHGEGRLHRPRGAAPDPRRRGGTPAVLHDPGRPLGGGRRQGADPPRRRGPRLRDQRQLRPLHRPRHRLRLPAGRVRRHRDERRDSILRGTPGGDGGPGASLRPRGPEDEGMTPARLEVLR